MLRRKSFCIITLKQPNRRITPKNDIYKEYVYQSMHTKANNSTNKDNLAKDLLKINGKRRVCLIKKRNLTNKS